MQTRSSSCQDSRLLWVLLDPEAVLSSVVTSIVSPGDVSVLLASWTTTEDLYNLAVLSIAEVEALFGQKLGDNFRNKPTDGFLNVFEDTQGRCIRRTEKSFLLIAFNFGFCRYVVSHLIDMR